jgi:ABC-type multidrug transport system permease subunit
MHYPAAFVIAQIATDIPLMLFQMTHFGIVIYFMVGLETTASAFFTFWIIIFASAMAMTACFRMIGAAFPTFDAATKASGLLVSALFMYMGYMIIKPEMKDWFVWIFWINPMSYGFEALLGNEFHNTQVPCVGPNLVPNGPGYVPGEGGQSCMGVNGAQPGASTLTGDQYLASMSFSHSHLWRNVGIIFAWWVFFVAVTIVFTSRWKEMGEGGRGLLIPREKQKKNKHIQANDEESQAVEKPQASFESSSSDGSLANQLIRNTSIFTWKNLTYTVKTPSGDRVLLDNVQGFVKPGTLGALMGSSGVSNILESLVYVLMLTLFSRLAKQHYWTFSPNARPTARSMDLSWLMGATFPSHSSDRQVMLNRWTYTSRCPQCVRPWNSQLSSDSLVKHHERRSFAMLTPLSTSYNSMTLSIP